MSRDKYSQRVQDCWHKRLCFVNFSERLVDVMVAACVVVLVNIVFYHINGNILSGLFIIRFCGLLGIIVYSFLRYKECCAENEQRWPS